MDLAGDASAVSSLCKIIAGRSTFRKMRILIELEMPGVAIGGSRLPASNAFSSANAASPRLAVTNQKPEMFGKVCKYSFATITLTKRCAFSKRKCSERAFFES